MQTAHPTSRLKKELNPDRLGNATAMSLSIDVRGNKLIFSIHRDSFFPADKDLLPRNLTESCGNVPRRTCEFKILLIACRDTYCIYSSCYLMRDFKMPLIIVRAECLWDVCVCVCVSVCYAWAGLCAGPGESCAR